MFVLNVPSSFIDSHELFITMWADSLEIGIFIFFKTLQFCSSFCFVLVPWWLAKSAFVMVFKMIGMMEQKIFFAHFTGEGDSRIFYNVTFWEEMFVLTKSFWTFNADSMIFLIEQTNMFDSVFFALAMIQMTQWTRTRYLTFSMLARVALLVIFRIITTTVSVTFISIYYFSSSSIRVYLVQVIIFFLGFQAKLVAPVPTVLEFSVLWIVKIRIRQLNIQLQSFILVIRSHVLSDWVIVVLNLKIA